ncbi:MAG: tetratricopeptide repeat protein [Bacteroidales bacterium]|nr:tetratricopeptide repeat protein [Bacteroidales bacterium]
MKRFLTVIFSLSIFCNLFAQNPSSTEAAEEFYKNQQYEEAIKIYQNILSEGETSAELFFNLGNSYFKLNELPQAILYYEKAILLSPNDKDIQYNLAFANSQHPDNIEHLSLGFLPRIYQKLYRLCSVDFWAISGLILLITFCISVILFLFTQTVTRKKIAFSVMLFSLCFGTLSFCSANSRHNELTAHEYAIVMEPTTSIKTEPMITAMDLATIHGGIKVKILEESFGWYKVELGNGKEGWLPANFAERI